MGAEYGGDLFLGQLNLRLKYAQSSHKDILLNLVFSLQEVCYSKYFAKHSIVRIDFI